MGYAPFLSLIVYSAIGCGALTCLCIAARIMHIYLFFGKMDNCVVWFLWLTCFRVRYLDQASSVKLLLLSLICEAWLLYLTCEDVIYMRMHGRILARLGDQKFWALNIYFSCVSALNITSILWVYN